MPNETFYSNLRLYMVGAHGTGKTTLAKEAAMHYRLRLITDTARGCAEKIGMGLDQIRSDLAACDGYQWQVFLAQLEAEKAAVSGFASDRAFDFLVYSAEYARNAGKIFDHPDFRNYVARLKADDAVVFFVRPSRSISERSGDGFRAASDLEWESTCRFDGQVQMILEQNDVPYVPVPTPSLRERFRIVEGVLRQRLMGYRCSEPDDHDCDAAPGPRGPVLHDRDQPRGPAAGVAAEPA